MCTLARFSPSRSPFMTTQEMCHGARCPPAPAPYACCRRARAPRGRQAGSPSGNASICETGNPERLGPPSIPERGSRLAPTLTWLGAHRKRKRAWRSCNTTVQPCLTSERELPDRNSTLPAAPVSTRSICLPPGGGRQRYGVRKRPGNIRGAWRGLEPHRQSRES